MTRDIGLRPHKTTVVGQAFAAVAVRTPIGALWVMRQFCLLELYYFHSKVEVFCPQNGDMLIRNFGTRQPDYTGPNPEDHRIGAVVTENFLRLSVLLTHGTHH
jgi:hypothetical protein